ncbi:ANKFN1, partial [Symbiodinium sp. KB8]
DFDTAPESVQELYIIDDTPGQGTFRVGHKGEYTDHLPSDVTAGELQAALNGLSTIRDVRVIAVTRDDPGFRILFLGDRGTDDIRELQVDDSTLEAGNSVTVAFQSSPVGTVDITIASDSTTVTVPSVPADLTIESFLTIGGDSYRVVDISGTTLTIAPMYIGAALTAETVDYGYTGLVSPLEGYTATLLPVDQLSADQLPDSTFRYRYVLEGHTVGVKAYTRVTPVNNMGIGVPQTSLPRGLAPPRQKPDIPRDVELEVDGHSSLVVYFMHPESDGGATISRYRVEWDTSSSFNGGEDGGVLGSYEMQVGSGQCMSTRCEVTIHNLMQGERYYVRVRAYNSYGYSVRAAVPVPASEVPRSEPMPPAYVITSPDPTNSSNLYVHFSPSANNRGAEVTKYRIEWDVQGHRAVVAGATSDEVLYSPYTVQTVTTSGSDHNFRGTFVLTFRDYSTPELSYAVSADDMRSALEALPTVGAVNVERRVVSFGFEWAVTFTGNRGPVPALEVTDSLTGTGSVTVATSITAFNGFEHQAFVVTSSSDSQVFVLSFAGDETAVMAWNIEAMDFKAQLEALGTGRLEVFRTITADQTNEIRYDVYFAEALGPQPDIEVVETATTADVEVHYLATGRFPAMDSSKRGSMIIEAPASGVAASSSIPAHLLSQYPTLAMSALLPSLEVGEDYFVKVSAWNGVGLRWGPTMYARPALGKAMRVPDAPGRVSVGVLSDTQMNVTWEVPLSNGGGPLTGVRVEWDTNPGVTEVQSVTVTGTSALSGTFTLGYGPLTTRALAHDISAADLKTALEALPSIGTVSTSRTNSGSFGFTWTITFVSNVGPQPALRLVYSGVNGNGVSGNVNEIRKGSLPGFDDGTIGIQVRPVGVQDLPLKSEVQTVTLTSSEEDLHGTFVLVYRGGLTAPIHWNASADEVAAALQGIETIGDVSVSKTVLRELSPTPHQRFGNQWAITFLSEVGD